MNFDLASTDYFWRNSNLFNILGGILSKMKYLRIREQGIEI